MSISVRRREGAGEPRAARALLAWYDGVRRPLPWRASRDPYRVWLSEVMLQQTLVATVVPYFEAFVAAYPTVEALAAAPLEEVLARWSGLGYYRRARQLHRAAREVVAARGFPSDAAGWRRLPGVGDYTAAAVASIAGDEVVAVLDGNVVRVIARLLGEEGEPGRRAVRERLRAEATALLDRRRPGDSNQALMELGATVCRPRRPDCEACPLASRCVARRAGDPERLPKPRNRRRLERVAWAAAVVRRGERVLLFRRDEGSELLAGTWELPTVALARDRRTVARRLAAAYGGRFTLAPERARVRHAITHRAITLHLHPAEWQPLAAGERTGAGERTAAWMDAAERAGAAQSSLVEKALAALA